MNLATNDWILLKKQNRDLEQGKRNTAAFYGSFLIFSFLTNIFFGCKFFKNRTFKEDNKNLNSDIKDIKKKFESYEKQINELKFTNEELVEKNETLEEKNKTLEEKNKELEKKNKTLEEKNKQLREASYQKRKKKRILFSEIAKYYNFNKNEEIFKTKKVSIAILQSLANKVSGKETKNAFWSFLKKTNFDFMKMVFTRSATKGPATIDEIIKFLESIYEFFNTSSEEEKDTFIKIMNNMCLRNIFINYFFSGKKNGMQIIINTIRAKLTIEDFLNNFIFKESENNKNYFEIKTTFDSFIFIFINKESFDKNYHSILEKNYGELKKIKEKYEQTIGYIKAHLANDGPDSFVYFDLESVIQNKNDYIEKEIKPFYNYNDDSSYFLFDEKLNFDKK